MPKRRNKLINRPNTRHAGAVDVLSDLLDTLRLATLMHGRFELGSPWGFQFPDEKSACIVVVVRGAARVEVAGGARPLVLSAGDLALLPHGGPHTLRDADGSALHVLGDAECRQVSIAETVRFGGNGTP